MQMRTVNQRDEPTGRRSRLLIGLVAVPLLIVLAFVLIAQLGSSGRGTSSAATLAGNSKESEAPTSTVSSHDEVVTRLHSIFRVRDKAIQERNPSLLKDIYTIDCPCLEGDRELIKGLRKKHLVWRGVKVSLVVEDIEQVNGRLWIINALVKTDSFNIEQESGALVRSVPSGHERSRFAIARLPGQEEWLLGRASVIAERD
jgi:hypothetical protein